MRKLTHTNEIETDNQQDKQAHWCLP